MKKIIFCLLIMSITHFCNAQQPYGCSLSISAKPSSNYLMFNYSGNAQLDAFLGREVNVLRNFFSVHPSVYYYQDPYPNALAMRDVEDNMFPSGTVLLGINLVNQEFQLSRSGTTIPFLLAHEFGHILDNSRNATAGYDSRTRELFADFQAGCFLFYRSVLTYTDVQAAMVSFYTKGDYDFNDPDHHGTSEERLNAFTAGYNWLRAKALPGVYVSPDEAIQADKNYLGIR